MCSEQKAKTIMGASYDGLQSMASPEAWGNVGLGLHLQDKKTEGLTNDVLTKS